MKKKKLNLDLDGISKVECYGEIYTIGNRYHGLLELFKNGKFIRTIDSREVKPIY